MAAVVAGYRKAWSALDGPFFFFLAQASFLLGTPFLAFQSGEVFSGWRALTIECPVMNGCGQGHWKEAEAQVSRANSWQKWKYR